MNVAPYIPLAGFFINVFFALFVFTRAPRAAANRVYLVLGLSIATWNLGCYLLLALPGEPRHHDAALFWARVVQFGCIFGVVAFFHLSLLIAGFKVGRWMRWLYGFQVLLAATNLTPLFIKDVVHLGSSGWYAQGGPVFYAFTLPFTLMFGSIFVILKRWRTLPSGQRRQLVPIIWAQGLLSIFGTNDILPIIGFPQYPFTQITVYPWGSLAAVFYGIVVAYSVLHHQLLQARVALSGALAHAVRFVFLFTIAGSLLLTVQTFTQVFNSASFWAAIIVFVISAVSASMLFPRLFGGKGLEKLERRIIGDRFEYQDQVRSFIENMAWYQDLPALLNDLHGLLTDVLRLESYQVILRDPTNRAFTLLRAFPDQPERQLAELRAESPVFRFFEWGKAEYLTLNSAYLRPTASPLERQALEHLAEFRGSFCFPLTSQNEPFGLFIVGAKTDDQPFTATDINLLITLVKSMGLMVNQIRLKNQILANQELDLLGRMSRGMAHDLNNLLTPVWTLLQLSCETRSDGGPAVFHEELLPSALRNVKVMQAYIREALFFSENLRPDFQLSRLDVVLKQATEVAKTSRKKRVEIALDAISDALTEIDEVLIQRVVANLICNAIDASPEGATIKVQLGRLAKTEAGRDWLRVRVIDQGEGIKKEDLNRIFAPYYTTKKTGDEGRGFGLGLAICRKIVNLHGGNLSVSSQLKRGTTIELDLPTRQAQALIPEALPQPA